VGFPLGCLLFTKQIIEAIPLGCLSYALHLLLSLRFILCSLHITRLYLRFGLADRKDILKDRNYCILFAYRDGHKARFSCILTVVVKQFPMYFSGDRFGLSKHLQKH